MAKIIMGCHARSRITGFRGVVIGVSHYLTGCTHYGITCPEAKGTPSETRWFDASEIERVGATVVKMGPRPIPDGSPGPAPRKPSSQH